MCAFFMFSGVYVLNKEVYLYSIAFQLTCSTESKIFSTFHRIYRQFLRHVTDETYLCQAMHTKT